MAKKPNIIPIINWDKSKGDEPEITLQKGSFHLNGKKHSIEELASEHGLVLDPSSNTFRYEQNPSRRDMIQRTAAAFAGTFFKNLPQTNAPLPESIIHQIGHGINIAGVQVRDQLQLQILQKDAHLSNKAILRNFGSFGGLGDLSVTSTTITNWVDLFSNSPILRISYSSLPGDRRNYSNNTLRPNLVKIYLSGLPKRELEGVIQRFQIFVNDNMETESITFNEMVQKICDAGNLLASDRTGDEIIESLSAQNKPYIDRVLKAQEAYKAEIAKKDTVRKDAAEKELTADGINLESSDPESGIFVLRKPVTDEDRKTLQAEIWDIAKNLVKAVDTDLNLPDYSRPQVIIAGNEPNPDASLGRHDTLAYTEAVEIRAKPGTDAHKTLLQLTELS